MVERAWKRVTRKDPCKICKKGDYCAYSGDMYLCMRLPSQRPSKCRLGGWIHIVGDDQPVLAPEPKMITKQVERINWDEIAYQLFWGANAREMRKSEATRLGIRDYALTCLGVGYYKGESGECSAWPERSPSGHVSGICIRYPDGRKKMIKGSRHGLYFDNLNIAPDKYGPIFMPEGGTDTAAIIGLYLNAIGRPSNTGGLDELAAVLSKFRHHKHLIVLGERDRREIKNNDHHDPKCPGCILCWPGLEGARLTARRLSAALGREVQWAIPDAKDTREWVNLNRPNSQDFLNAAFQWSRK